MIEVCHGIEPYPQPSPGRNAGGDCFACALTAGLRWLFPEVAVSFDTVFECFEGEFYDPRAHENLELLRGVVGEYLEAGDVETLRAAYAKVDAERAGTTTYNNWGGYEKALHRAANTYGEGVTDLDITHDLVEREFHVDRWSHAWWWTEPTTAWARRVEGWLRSGYVAFAEQRFDGDGPYDAELKFRSVDHFVLIDGVRLGWEQAEGHSGRGYHSYAHVVCSVRGGYWIDVRDLMRKHGTAGLILARRYPE